MTIPTSKAELLEAISTQFDRLITDLAKVPADRAREKTLEGHVAASTMSPADLVAYLLGWNTLVLKWLERDEQGLPVDFPETGFKWNELGRLAQKFYQDYHELSYPQLLNALEHVKQRLADYIATRSDEELYGRAWYGKWTKGRMIQFNTSSPYANARGRIRKWLKA
ncbi:ClbS/DfsB family four-helix bundle protein [Massilia sp. SR12]